MISISHMEYEVMHTQLAEQRQKLDVKTAKLAQALLQNCRLTEQLDQLVMERFANLLNETEAWGAGSVEPSLKS